MKQDLVMNNEIGVSAGEIHNRNNFLFGSSFLFPLLTRFFGQMTIAHKGPMIAENYLFHETSGDTTDRNTGRMMKYCMIQYHECFGTE